MAETKTTGLTPITVSVGELVNHLLRTGDLSSEYQGAKRALEGIRLHQRIQSQRPEDYQAEVPLSYTDAFEGIELTLTGRVDGIYGDPEADSEHLTIIEEIKSSYSDVTALSEYKTEHWGQLQCYGFMYAVTHDLEAVQLQLTYGQIGSTRQKQFTHPADRKTLQTIVDDWMRQYARWLRHILDWRKVRNRSIKTVAFPFPQYREGQRNMAVAVYRTIQAHGQTLVQAPTGVGKTIAAVFPAIKAMAETGITGISRFFYLTARTTGKKVAEDALGKLRQAGLKFKSLSLTAKEKICLNETMDCSAQACPYAKGHFDRIDPARWEFFEHDDFTSEILHQIARGHQVCPFALATDLAGWMDGLIGDYNYVFDPQVSLKSLWAEHAGELVILVDEAHNLVDRAREMFSAELFCTEFEDLLPEMPDTLRRLMEITGKIIDHLHTFAIQPRQTEGVRWHKEPLEQDFLDLLVQFLIHADHWLARNPTGEIHDALLGPYFRVHGFLKVAEADQTGYLLYDELQGDDLKIKYWCVDPAAQLAVILNQARAALFFSATLTPWTFFQRLFGCKPDAVGIRLPSPFPPQNLAVSAISAISTRYKDRRRTKSEVAQAISTFINQKPGNYLIFFPSYAYLEMIHDELRTLAPEQAFLVQETGMSEPQRADFLNRFEDPVKNPVTALAVMGGIFGEGIDLKGDRLAGTAIIGVGLPGLSPERQKMRDYYHAHDGLGFEYAFAFPGITRVLQAAGRVIRSARDKGAVLLIDDRYRRSPYRNLLPDHWQIQWLPNQDLLKQSLQDFWQTKDV